MKNLLFPLRIIFGLIFLIALVTPLSGRVQEALERLEKQIRQRVGADPENPPLSQDAPLPLNGTPLTAPPQKNEPKAAEKWEPGYLGLRADDRQDRGRGVRVVDIYFNGPAAKGGLKKQDLITAIAGIRIRQMSEMSDVLNLYAAGETVDFEILREDKPLKLKVALGSRPLQKTAGTPIAEAIPLPPGKAVPQEPPVEENVFIKRPVEPSSETPPPPGAIKPSILNRFIPKSSPPGEQGIAESNAEEPPIHSSPRTETSKDQSTVERLEKRVDQLERRVAELEKALEEVKQRAN